MSSQYWTASVYASENVIHRAWDNFLSNINDDASWSYRHMSRGEYEIERWKEVGHGEENQYIGDIAHWRYQSLVEEIEYIEREIEEEKIRLEEERRQREIEEQARKDAAHRSVIDAISRANSMINDNQFESAEQILRSESHNFISYQSELDFSQYTITETKIKSEKGRWIANTIDQIKDLIRKKEWDRAKKLLDSVPSERASSTNSTKQFSDLRQTLNRQKKEWEEAERERIRLENLANQKKAKELITANLNNWNPIIAEADLLQDIKGYDVFISHQKSGTDWEFLDKYSDWSKNSSNEELIETSTSIYRDARSNLLVELLTDLVVNQVSRNNILTDEILAGNADPLNQKEMSEALNNGIKEYFEDIHRYISANDYTIDENVIQEFTIKFVNSRNKYIDEVRKAKNTELAKAMIGKFLKLQTNDDFVTMVSKSYIGEHSFRVFIDDDEGKRRELTDTNEIATHIQEGGNLVIILEDCYNAEQEQQQGHIKNRKIFEN